MSYECEYCGDALCPEICPKAKAAYQKHIKDKDDKKDIIAYLEGYWEEYLQGFSLSSKSGGTLYYHKEYNVLYAWSGLGDELDYGYEVEIKDLQHLMQLEALL